MQDGIFGLKQIVNHMIKPKNMQTLLPKFFGKMEWSVLYLQIIINFNNGHILKAKIYLINIQLIWLRKGYCVRIKY